MLEVLTLAVIAAILMMGNPFGHDFALAGFPEGFKPDKPERKPWEDLVMFKKGGGGGSAPAADPNIGKAAVMQAQTGNEWLKFAREQFAVGNERQKVVDALTDQVTTTQLEGMQESNAHSKEQWDRYKTVFQPVEDRVVSDAVGWDSEERQDKQAAEAKADVMANAESAQQQNQRQMASMGIDPRSGRHDGIERSADLSTALASAGAQNNARNAVRTQGAAMREGVANMGRGATSTAAQQLGLGITAGNSASGNQLGAEGNWRANQSGMNAGFAGQMQGYAGQGSTLNNLYGNQLQGWQAQQSQNNANAAGLMSGIGTAAGMAMAFG